MTRNRNGAALRIALIYAVVSAAWILFSDLLIAGFADRRLYERLSIIKGWFFVVVTAGLLYMLVQRTIRRIVKAEAQTSLILNSVGDGVFIFHMEDGVPGKFVEANEAAIERLGYSIGELRTITPFDLVPPELREEVSMAARDLLDTGAVVLETCMVSRDGRPIPVEVSARTVRVDDTVMAVVVARDIAERKREEERRREEAVAAERDKRRFYRETITAVTGGKFELADSAEAEGWIRDPEVSIQLSGSDEIADARHDLIEYCRASGMVDSSADEFELAVGEALGNAIKHVGEAWAFAGTDDDRAWVAVADHGKGIDTFMIPKVVILPGFSTEASLGLGYTLILRVCDHVKLATGPEGTTVVMEKMLTPPSAIDRDLAVFAGIE